MKEKKYFQTFPDIGLFLYSLKTSENQRFSDVFKGYRSGTLVENGLNENFQKSFP